MIASYKYTSATENRREGNFLLSLDCFIERAGVPVPLLAYLAFYYLLIASGKGKGYRIEIFVTFYYLLIASCRCWCAPRSTSPAFLLSLDCFGLTPRSTSLICFHHFFLLSLDCFAVAGYAAYALARRSFLLSLDCFREAHPLALGPVSGLSTIS